RPARLAGLGVPDLHERIVPGRGHLPAVRADRQRVHFVAVGDGQGFLALVRPEGGRVPDPNSLVDAGRGEAVAVRAESHAPAAGRVPAEAEHLPAGLGVPEAHRLILAAGREAPAVRTEDDAIDVAGVQQVVDNLAGRRVAHVHAPAEGGRGQPQAV